MINKEPGNEHLWRQFIRLGEMMGDGLHHEEPWIAKEYKRLMMILCPPTVEEKAAIREHKNKSINAQMAELLKDRHCSCGGSIKQSRSGSKTAYCDRCRAKFKAKPKKQSE